MINNKIMNKKFINFYKIGYFMLFINDLYIFVLFFKQEIFYLPLCKLII
jgi:hypothetical protein